MVNGKFKISLILILWVRCNIDTLLFKFLDHTFFGGIQITDDEIWFDPESQGMTRTAVCADDRIRVVNNGTPFIEIWKFAVGEDNDALQRKILQGRRMVDSSVYSLRQHDLDQVLRVERITLLSARPCTGTPFNCHYKYTRNFETVNRYSELAHAPPPFFLHLQFTRA